MNGRASTRALSTRIAGASLAVLLGSTGCETRQVFKMPEWSLQRMVHQRKFEPYELNPFFDDQRAMRVPPEGTISRTEAVGASPLVLGAEDGRPVTELPVPLTRALLERGRDRFNIFCGPCHGVAGNGVSVVAEVMTVVPPPSLHSERIRSQALGRIFQTTSEGYGVMPSYAAQLPLLDRWAVTAYVRVLQDSQNVELARLPEDVRREAEEALR